MPSKKSDLKQARIALKKLRELGLYTGDLRKKPTKSALSKIKKYDDVLSGKAVVVQPKNPARFKNIFEVRGKSVIVPRRKGERISIDKKTGEIVSKRKVGKRTVTARGRQIKRGQKIEQPAIGRRVQYAIPFNASGGGVNWFRFPDWEELQKFMAGYDYKNWADYVIEEDIEDELDDEELEEKLQKQLRARKRKRAARKTKAKKSARKRR